MKPFSDITDPPVRLGRIEYINSAPVYYGLDTEPVDKWCQITSGPPSVLNTLMAENRLEASPVSSSAFARNCDHWIMLPHVCIGCRGEVMSVKLVSRFPMEQLQGKRILLTEDSATSVDLLKILLSQSGIVPQFETGIVKNAPRVFAQTDAALVIGDAALRENWGAYFSYQWDMGKLWKEKTGLPFVFAIWAVRRSFAKRYPDRVIAVSDLLNQSLQKGLTNIDILSEKGSAKLGIGIDVCRKYYQCLNHQLLPKDIRGLEKFFDQMHRCGLIQARVEPEFFIPTDFADTVPGIPHIASVPVHDSAERALSRL